MRNFQVTIRPFMIEANSLHEAKKLVANMIPNQEVDVKVEECMSVDSILNDLLGEEDAKLFMDRIDSELVDNNKQFREQLAAIKLDKDEGDNREPMPSYEEAQRRKEERRKKGA